MLHEIACVYKGVWVRGKKIAQFEHCVERGLSQSKAPSGRVTPASLRVLEGKAVTNLKEKGPKKRTPEKRMSGEEREFGERVDEIGKKIRQGGISLQKKKKCYSKRGEKNCGKEEGLVGRDLNKKKEVPGKKERRQWKDVKFLER